MEDEVDKPFEAFAPISEFRIEDTWCVAGVSGIGNDAIVDEVSVSDHRRIKSSNLPINSFLSIEGLYKHRNPRRVTNYAANFELRTLGAWQQPEHDDLRLAAGWDIYLAVVDDYALEFLGDRPQQIAVPGLVAVV
jgi:hypothetical protein